MLGRHLANVTLSTGDTATAWTELKSTREDIPARNVAVVSTDTALTNTVTVQVSASTEGGVPLLASSGGNVEVPANSAQIIRDLPLPQLRFSTTAAEAAERQFQIWLQ